MNEYIPVIIAYFFGAIPFGLIVAKIFVKIDIREHGSKNIGATNVLRVCGKKFGIPVLILDALKGFIPVASVSMFNCFPIPEDSIPLISALTACSAVLGHTFPIYLKFKGGKGVATSSGAFLALLPATFGIAFLTFFITVLLTRYISLGSSLGAVAMIVAYHFFSIEPYGKTLPITILVWVVSLLVVVKHRANFRRIIKGKESKFGKKNEA